MSTRHRWYDRSVIAAIRNTPKPYFDFFASMAIRTNEPLWFPRNAGKDFLCLCPLHKERTPSLRITYKETIGRNQRFQEPFWLFKCFGCGKSGDYFKLMEYYHGQHFSFIEEVGRLLLERTVPAYLAHYNPDQLVIDYGPNFRTGK